MPDNDDDDGPDHDTRGIYRHGPRNVNPSDLLAKMIGFTYCREPTEEPREARRKMRLYSARAAAAQRGRKVRPWEC